MIEKMIKRSLKEERLHEGDRWREEERLHEGDRWLEEERWFYENVWKNNYHIRKMARRR